MEFGPYPLGNLQDYIEVESFNQNQQQMDISVIVL